MYPYITELSTGGKALIGLFSLGFLRGVCADYPEGYDLIGKRMGYGLINGAMYVFPPYGLLRSTDVINRADVAWNNKDKEKYTSIYSECGGLGTNPRVLF